MEEEIDIQEKIWNIDLVINEIKDFPQTYKTILQHEYTNGTYKTILRRKMSRLCKSGIVYKTTIPGTRFGKAIFYALPKKYYILVEAGRLGSNVFIFFKYKKTSRYWLKVKESWKLKKGVWEQLEEEKNFFEGNILKFI